MTFLKFHKLTSFALAIGATALLGGCGNNNKNGATDATPVPSSTPTSSKGTIAADWTYTGSEAPSRVKILLVDAASNGLTCTTMPFAPAAGVLQTLPNLPANGAANFTQVAPGTKYIVLAIGETASGARVAAACHDQVNVIAGQITDVSLILNQFVADLTGTYAVAQNLNIGLPTNVQNALSVVAAACGILNNAQLCNIVSQVNNILTSMDVVSQWTIDQQPDGTYTGTVKWLSVQGLDVSTLDLVDGTFKASVPGSTQISYKDFNLTIQFGNLVLFVVQDVLGYDLGQFGPFGSTLITALASNYVSPMSFTGTGAISDVNADGVADKLAGNLAGHIQIVSWQHDFGMDYVALRP